MRTVFIVRVVTKNMFSDTLASFKSIIGGRVRAYEKVITQALREAETELRQQYPNVLNVRIGTTEMIKDGAEVIVYGEVTDEEYKEANIKRKRT